MAKPSPAATNAASTLGNDSDCEIQEIRRLNKSQRKAINRKRKQHEAVVRDKKRAKTEPPKPPQPESASVAKKKTGTTQNKKQLQKKKTSQVELLKVISQKSQSVTSPQETNSAIHASPRSKSIAPSEFGQLSETTKGALSESEEPSNTFKKPKHDVTVNSDEEFELEIFYSPAIQDEEDNVSDASSEDENEYISKAISKQPASYTSKKRQYVKDKTKAKPTDKNEAKDNLGQTRRRAVSVSSISTDSNIAEASESDCIIDEVASTPSPRKGVRIVRRNIKTETAAGKSRHKDESKALTVRKTAVQTSKAKNNYAEGVDSGDGDGNNNGAIQLQSTTSSSFHITNDLGLVQFHFEAMHNHIAALEYLANTRTVQQQQIVSGFRRLVRMIPRMPVRPLFVKMSPSYDTDEDTR